MQAYQKRLALSLLAYFVQRNGSLDALCQASGIVPDDLKAEASPGLSAQQVSDLWLNAAQLTQDSLFGLHFGESMQVSALGVVGELIRYSQTVGEALTHAAAFVQLITEVLTMDVHLSDRSFTIQFIPRGPASRESPDVFRQMMDFFMAFTLHEVDGLVLEKVRPMAVALPVEPDRVSEYRRVFRCQSVQNSEAYVLTFDQAFWDEPILTADHELQAVLLRKISALDVDLGPSKSLRERIHSFLLANAYLGVPTLEAMACNLNLSSRSLQRKLQDEGVTYQQLTDSVRKLLALHYLQAGQYPVKEVSYMLGYNELSAFNRAFRRWTGTTPVSYQKQKAGANIYS